MELKQVWILGPVIIGVGPSGLATAACLKQRGVPSLILEKESCVGSLWKLKAYDRLRLHLPKRYCELPYVPFPPEYLEYPTKQEFIGYLEAYAKQFSIKPIFNEEVQWATYDAIMGFWRLQTCEFEYVCKWLVVASGENAEPVLPDITGISDFKGKIMHTSSYKSRAEFNGSKVLVVGCGNSGMEVSLDLCKNGAEVSIVIREEVHVLPRQIFGQSTFGLSMWLLQWFPIKLVDLFLLFFSGLILGDLRRVGIQRPKLGPLELKNHEGRTPVLDVGAIARIKFGEIKVVGEIKIFLTNGAKFADGKVEQFDSVILATGYQSNVTSWLKEDNFFSKKDGYPKKPFPNNWKGENGVYSVGFNKRGLLGACMDAEKVAEDIARKWKLEMKCSHGLELYPSHYF